MARTHLMLAALVAVAACTGPAGDAGDTPPISPGSLASAAGPGGGGGGGGGEEEEGAGNNLSVPVIWSDGTPLALRGTMLEATLGGAFTTAEGTDWYHQQDELNAWQAESLALVPGVDPMLTVDWVDWGDNLEAKDWTSNQPIRVETTLRQTLTTAMQGFTMRYLAGEGPDEMWGTDGTLYDATEAHVYSGADGSIEAIPQRSPWLGGRSRLARRPREFGRAGAVAGCRQPACSRPHERTRACSRRPTS